LKEISMKVSIGKFDAAARTVPVTFEHDGVTHKRDVNACLTGAGGYDKKATAERVEEVAKGVAHKIKLGVITNPPPEPEVPEAPAS
jgi:hypothetical protein